jgi:hypothetical protein
MESGLVQHVFTEVFHHLIVDRGIGTESSLWSLRMVR